MRLLLPPPARPDEAVDPVEHVWALERRPPPARPWVLVNMIASADGATAVDGVSGGLGGPADKAMFAALRQVPDVVLAAAGTVRAEGYRPLRPAEEVQARRVAQGLAPVARLAIVTASLDLDLDDPLFTESDPRPVVITGAAAPEQRLAAVAEVADVVVTRGERADLGEALARLGEDGARVVLCEGGPSLLGQLVAEDLVDELDLTLAPALVGGDSARVVHSAHPGTLRGLHLDAACEQEGMLFLRYLRRR